MTHSERKGQVLHVLSALNLLADVTLDLSDAGHVRGPGLAGPVTSQSGLWVLGTDAELG